jgi:hypothetical protein
MPKTRITQEFELKTRNEKVEAEIQLMVNGRELPTAATLGSALEKGLAVIQEEISNAYKLVPARV